MNYETIAARDLKPGDSIWNVRPYSNMLDWIEVTAVREHQAHDCAVVMIETAQWHTFRVAGEHMAVRRRVEA